MKQLSDPLASRTHPAHRTPSGETDPLVTKNRAVWAAGDFDRIAAGYRDGSAAFVDRLGLRPAQRVLDVACGTGNLTLPAARAGADVLGLDIAPNLLDTARQRAAQAGLSIPFEEGNAEALPYADGAFDSALSMFGAMFAPRPERVAAELLRVVRPGGWIAMANWTPRCFIGSMLRAHTALVPPPAGTPSTLLWGDDAAVRERFAAASEVTLTVRSIWLEFPVPPRAVVELFKNWYGPTVRTFEALDPAGQAKLFESLLHLWTEHNQGTEGSTRVESEYLEVVVTR
jgi:ubiquinone/menaquinone biosynthesis C-methylase UbiE